MIVLRRKQFANIFNMGGNIRQAFSRYKPGGKTAYNTALTEAKNKHITAGKTDTEAMNLAKQEVNKTDYYQGAGEQVKAGMKAVGGLGIYAGGAAIGAGALGLGAVNSMGAGSFDALKGNMGGNSEGY